MPDIKQDSLFPAYENLRNGNIEEAEDLLDAALMSNLDNNEIKFALSCLSFWKDKINTVVRFSSPSDKSEWIFRAWLNFVEWSKTLPGRNEDCIDAARYFVFNRALEFCSKALEEHQGATDIEIYRKTGLCYKNLGDYDNALRFLDYAFTRDSSSAKLVADLADCYALTGDMQKAKVLFREAFFIGASEIELDFLSSEIITRLISETEKMGYRGEELALWIPVYGVIYGIFNVKRELRAVELGKLKQACYAMETQLCKADETEKKYLVPRLLNHYFWLIDHYINTDDDRTKINEILLKIKIIDPDVYSKYDT